MHSKNGKNVTTTGIIKHTRPHHNTLQHMRHRRTRTNEHSHSHSHSHSLSMLFVSCWLLLVVVFLSMLCSGLTSAIRDHSAEYYLDHIVDLDHNAGTHRKTNANNKTETKQPQQMTIKKEKTTAHTNKLTTNIMGSYRRCCPSA